MRQFLERAGATKLVRGAGACVGAWQHCCDATSPYNTWRGKTWDGFRFASRSASSGTRQASGADGAAAPLMHTDTVQWRRCAGRERQGNCERSSLIIMRRLLPFKRSGLHHCQDGVSGPSHSRCPSPEIQSETPDGRMETERPGSFVQRPCSA